MAILSSSRPLALAPAAASRVYALLALALGLTLLGTFLGIVYAPVLLNSGLLLFMLIAELVLIFTSGFWSRVSPWNVVLFCAFPFFSGVTITPYILMVLVGYANGASILLNALLATALMVASAAVLARAMPVNLLGIGNALLLGLLGLLVLGVLQIFFPMLRTGTIELLSSGFGIVLFSLFISYDLQRLIKLRGVNPFQLALSLYLDIFNLFLSVLRFMVALSGKRR